MDWLAGGYIDGLTERVDGFMNQRTGSWKDKYVDRLSDGDTSSMSSIGTWNLYHLTYVLFGITLHAKCLNWKVKETSCAPSPLLCK